MNERVRIVEVSPRDGLQNEKQTVPVEVKLGLIERLADAGFTTIEATAFVSPKAIPQLADAEQVCAGLKAHAGVTYPVLVPNEKGMQRALAAGVREVAVFTAASETFNQRNINASIADSLDRFQPVMALAREHGVRVRGYVSTVLGCPYEGEVAVAKVVEVARALHDMGCYEVSLGDTVGYGTPRKARALLEAVASEVPMAALAAHFHDTRGQALANLHACLEAGVRVIDASVGGIGGCPYAEGATGNVATEDVLYMLHGLGFTTGVDLPKAIRAGQYISAALSRAPQSKLGRLPDAQVDRLR